jgi:hypothetical protein
VSAPRHPNGRYARPGYGGRDGVTGEYHADRRNLAVLYSPAPRPRPDAPDWSSGVREVILPGGQIVFQFPGQTVLPKTAKIIYTN